MSKEKDPLFAKIIKLFEIPDHEKGSIAIEHFTEWFIGTEEVAREALERLDKEFGGAK